MAPSAGGVSDFMDEDNVSLPWPCSHSIEPFRLISIMALLHFHYMYDCAWHWLVHGLGGLSADESFTEHFPDHAVRNRLFVHDIPFS